jgi:hypothetical protein
LVLLVRDGLTFEQARVLVAEQHKSMSRELDTFPIGAAVDVEDDVVTFPNGQTVRFASSAVAQRVAEVACTGEA